MQNQFIYYLHQNVYSIFIKMHLLISKSPKKTLTLKLIACTVNDIHEESLSNNLMDVIHNHYLPV